MSILLPKNLNKRIFQKINAIKIKYNHQNIYIIKIPAYIKNTQTKYDQPKKKVI